MEKRLLQTAIIVAALVPILAGLAGVVWGPAMAGSIVGAAFDSHFRYLSGLLIGVGAAYWSLAPSIEREGQRLFMLTLIVVVGGFFRALGMLIDGPPGVGMSLALALELIVAPALYVWQTRIARLTQGPPASMDATTPWR
ncbi:MAG: DUF4345 domain-containing protein [Caulobacteraceae bacterium]|nr:DUF4345 domain-containing protein [Caulobacteraceae bacterium]